MNRSLLSCALGLFSIAAYFCGAAVFERPGRNSLREVAAGCVVLMVYVAAAQCLLPRDPDGDAFEDWRVRARMAACLIPIAALIIATSPSSAILGQAVPMLAAACAGCLAGGWAARSFARRPTSDAIAKKLSRVAVGLCLAVAIFLAAAVAPILAKDTSHFGAPGSPSGPMLVCAVFHLLFPGLIWWRTRNGKTPILPAILTFLFAVLFFGIALTFLKHAPTLRVASITLFGCAALDLLICGCCVGFAIERPDRPEEFDAGALSLPASRQL